LSYPTSYNFDVNNVIYYEGQTVNTGIAHTELYLTSFDVHVEHAALISDHFTYVIDDTDYPLSYMADDGAGVIKVYCSINEVIQPIATIGTIDYTLGVIKIDNLKTSYYDNYISIYVKPRDKDIIAKNDKIIIIDSNDITISVIETKR
jgi:hypothetical protein